MPALCSTKDRASGVRVPFALVMDIASSGTQEPLLAMTASESQKYIGSARTHSRYWVIYCSSQALLNSGSNWKRVVEDEKFFSLADFVMMPKLSCCFRPPTSS